MATNPKMLPCPKCGRTDFLAVYDYDGWRHVECDNGFNSTPTPPATEACHYLGPGEGSIRQAIKSHNERVLAAHQTGERKP
jgi:Zn ribbon nucleic-acid-binding protein